MQTSTDLKKLTSEARQILTEWQKADSTIITSFDCAIERAWQLGKKLNQLKQLIGHGSWEHWRASAFAKLSKRQACNCMALDRDNPNVQKSAHLSKESVRKFRFGYIPVKDRPKQSGDRSFSRPSHHSTVVNECNKLIQRIEAGQYKPNESELLKDFRPFYEWLSARYQEKAPR